MLKILSVMHRGALCHGDTPCCQRRSDWNKASALLLPPPARSMDALPRAAVRQPGAVISAAALSRQGCYVIYAV